MTRFLVLLILDSSSRLSRPPHEVTTALMSDDVGPSRMHVPLPATPVLIDPVRVEESMRSTLAASRIGVVVYRPVRGRVDVHDHDALVVMRRFH